uniref:Uncharacterized protein n=1 Tax=Tanacetum cinerariifolium TaxID=118510 RepID=A0A6L2J903_TANCI|nr:hypothetical protein [Tanacetum cinerariifolium]
METTVPQKEEKFQVVMDLIKNSLYFKAFTIFVDVPKKFIRQLWYSIKKVQGTDSYEFLLANMKCVVNADIFRMILDICLRMKGVNFTDVPDDDTTLAFLIELGYKGPLYKHTTCFWITCISHGELWQKNVYYPELIWEDLAYQIDHMKEKRSRRKNMSFPQEFKPELEQVKRKTSSKRRVKKKVTLSTNDNIISDDPATALKLGKFISKTKVKAETAIQVHVTHARIVIESVLEPTKRRKSGKVTCNPPKKLKSVPSLTPEDLEAADIMQAHKLSKKTSKRHPCKEKGITEENAILELGSKQESENSVEDKLDDEEKYDKEGDAEDEGNDHISDIQDTNDEDDETKSDEDDIYKYKIRMRKDEDEEMLNDKVEDSDKGDEEVTDAVKADAETSSEVKNDNKKTKLPLTSSSLSVSSDATIKSLFEVKIQSKVPHIQSPSMLRVLVSMISKPKVLTPVQETSSAAPITTLPPLLSLPHHMYLN